MDTFGVTAKTWNLTSAEGTGNLSLLTELLNISSSVRHLGTPNAAIRRAVKLRGGVMADCDPLIITRLRAMKMRRNTINHMFASRPPLSNMVGVTAMITFLKVSLGMTLGNMESSTFGLLMNAFYLKLRIKLIAMLSAVPLTARV
jgi:hypothetical protein